MASPGEGVVALASTKGTGVETVVLVNGSTLGGGVSTPNAPVDAKGLVVGGGKAKTWVTFCPGNLPISEFGGGGRFEVGKDGVPPLCADEANSSGGRLAAA